MNYEKTVILTAGSNHEDTVDSLRKYFLPTLRREGEYTGTVLIVASNIRPSIDDNNVLVRTTNYETNLESTAKRFYEFSKYLDHDGKRVVVAIDSGDIIFQSPLEPLLNMKMDGVGIVGDTDAGGMKWNIGMAWNSINIDKFKSLESHPLLNAGMVIGREDVMKMLFDNMTELIGDETFFGVDQISMNYVLYHPEIYRIPLVTLPPIYNYTICHSKFELKSGRCYDANGNLVAVVHNNGRGCRRLLFSVNRDGIINIQRK